MTNNTNSKPKKPDLGELAQFLNVQYLPPLDSDDVQSLHKALPGYQAISDDTARFIKEYNSLLNLEPAVLADLEEGLAEVARLKPVERVLEKLQLSIYHQRLQATARCMGALYDTNRRVRELSNAHPHLPEEAKFLIDFMKAFRPGRKKEKKQEGGGE
uniref:Uncharacterized protein n=1 Tax=Candidatus Kentrum sp. FW TaxID=2126338 RepID=A0A450TA96_9GAMM|nr:MAG: hypothetical protein BECKFW1821C_GA0114237_100448 [Candidatus Kentron sp. FW]